MHKICAKSKKYAQNMRKYARFARNPKYAQNMRKYAQKYAQNMRTATVK